MEIGEQHVLLVKRMPARLRNILKHLDKQNYEIASEVGLTTVTVNSYMTRLYKELGLQAISSNTEKRLLASRMYKAFARIYDVDSEGNIIDREAMQKFLNTMASPPSPAAVNPLRQNGHDTSEGKSAPTATPAPRPASGVPGYGVGLTIQVPDPQTVADIAPLVLGSEGSAQKMQELMMQGYVPEIINDYQSLSGSRSITKIFLVKRKA